MFVTAAIGAIVGAVIGGVVAHKQGKSVWKGALIGAAAGGLIGLGAGAAAGAILAGSATASTAAVAAGTTTLVSTVSSGGLGAGAAYLYHNISNALNNTTPQVSTALQTYYPPNQGFAGVAQQTSLDVGTVVQRIGSLSGRYIAPAGTPSQMLALPYNQIGQSTTYLEVCKSTPVLSGTVAPWFGQIGGGTQYILQDGRVDQLIADGVLKIFEGF